MCGILGLYDLNKNHRLDERKFEDSLLKMNHRGPDSHSIKKINQDVIFGHVRLSIIDLNEISNQPFYCDDRYWIVFNGEIFNYIELKNELISLGVEFQTAGDTEVLLKSYIYWGEECVKKLNGMWAFAIFDSLEDKLFCSRDRFGVKPFDYSFIDNQFIFSSEIKSIINYFPNLKKPNYKIITNYCYSSIGAQHKETWFESIFRLEPAHNLVITNEGITIEKYWDYPKKINNSISFDEAVIEYRKLFFDSVKLRMRSDVPIGFTLSSGIDSTSIVSILEKEYNNNTNTYTACFDPQDYKISEKKNYKKNVTINEADIVQRLTNELNLKSNLISIDFSNYIEDLSKIIYHLESGHGSPAVFPLYKILQEAKKDVIVVLEGQGADELMAGYINTSFPIYFIELLKKFQFKTALRELNYFKENYSLKTSFMLAIRQSNFKIVKKLYYKLSGVSNFLINELSQAPSIKDYPNEPKGFNNDLNNHLFKAHSGGLVNLLHYGDAVSMANSLESRLPFMDYRLVEFCFSLPSSFKIKNGYGKYIHREAMKGILPDYILENKLKFGFDSPLAQLFSVEGENSASSILLSESCLNRGIFNQNSIIQALNDLKTGKNDQSRLLYRLLSVELWFRMYID